ncbi:PfkB family carbohydrate kinase [Alloyangia pacifica]|uniref:PfkB family carbohydrate kinase n=1 Tax=Alloyangia pacifica TaxID=311180 RepID=UPI001CFE9A3E|nr:PfkB family carbohydrate kinase [Alloyangia pacifica]
MSVAIMDAGGDYGAVIVSGANLKIDQRVFAEEALWQGATHLVLQNEVPEALNFAAAKSARERGIEVVLNAAPTRGLSDELVSAIDILLVNAGEAEALCGIPVTSLENGRDAARALAERFSRVVVTARGDGVAVAGGGTDYAEPGHNVVLVSTHGAGDCFIGTIIASLAHAKGIEAAAANANLAAAQHVSRPKSSR